MGWVLKSVAVVVLSVVVLFGAFVLMTLNKAGVFRDLDLHGIEGCNRVGADEGVVGAEDLFAEGELLFISSDPRHRYW